MTQSCPGPRIEPNLRSRPIPDFRNTRPAHFLLGVKRKCPSGERSHSAASFPGCQAFANSSRYEGGCKLRGQLCLIGDSALRGKEIDEAAKRHDRHPLEAEPLEIVLDGFAQEIRAAVED